MKLSERDSIIWPVTACEDDCASWVVEAALACDCGADEARQWIAVLKARFAALEAEFQSASLDWHNSQARVAELEAAIREAAQKLVALHEVGHLIYSDRLVVQGVQSGLLRALTERE